jgi:hypothetical protein
VIERVIEVAVGLGAAGVTRLGLGIFHPHSTFFGPTLWHGPRDRPQVALTFDDGPHPTFTPRIARQLDEQGSIEVAGERLTADEVEVRAERHEAFALAEDQGWAVGLDLELDDDLRAEGTARELVRALNDLRKEHDLDIADRITLTIDADDALRAVIDAHRAWITGEVLCTDLTLGPATGDTITVDGDTVRVALAIA